MDVYDDSSNDLNVTRCQQRHETPVCINILRRGAAKHYKVVAGYSFPFFRVRQIHHTRIVSWLNFSKQKHEPNLRAAPLHVPAPWSLRPSRLPFSPFLFLSHPFGSVLYNSSVFSWYVCVYGHWFLVAQPPPKILKVDWKMYIFLLLKKEKKVLTRDKLLQRRVAFFLWHFIFVNTYRILQTSISRKGKC